MFLLQKCCSRSLCSLATVCFGSVKDVPFEQCRTTKLLGETISQFTNIVFLKYILSHLPKFLDAPLVDLNILPMADQEVGKGGRVNSNISPFFSSVPPCLIKTMDVPRILFSTKYCCFLW